MFCIVVPRADPAPLPSGIVTKPSEVSDPTILLVEDNPDQLNALRALLELEGYRVVPAQNDDEALAQLREARGMRPHVVIADYNLGRSSNGLEVIERLQSAIGAQIPALILSGDLAMPVKAMREGAADFFSKARMQRETARERGPRPGKRSAKRTRGVQRAEVMARLATPTPREKQVMQRMLLEEATKNIAAALGINQRATEHQRHSVMRKMNVRSLAILVRLVTPAMFKD